VNRHLVSPCHPAPGKEVRVPATKKLRLKLYSYAEASTAHVTADDDRQLAVDAVEGDERTGTVFPPYEPRLIVFQYDAGYFVHTGVAEDKENMDLLSARYSPGLLRLLTAAYEQGAIFLRLDRDGDLYGGLERHEW
jgi:hypothetical protein